MCSEKAQNGKAAGLTGVPAEAFKAMHNENLLHIHKHVHDFFLGTADHEQWHRSQCATVPKSGDLLGPKKWCGIMLMDVGSKTKIFSSVMNERAFKQHVRHQIPIRATKGVIAYP